MRSRDSNGTPAPPTVAPWLLSVAGAVLVIALTAVAWVLITAVSHAREGCEGAECGLVEVESASERVVEELAPGGYGVFPGDSAFVASRRGSVYYPRACEAWSTLSPGNLVWFADEAAAVAAGYRRSGSSACRWDGSVLHPSAAADIAHAPDGVCTVERIVDGDTLVCREGGERIRLLLVDAPELSQGEYGRLASGVLEELLPVGTVAGVELDVRERDRYRRLLAYLYDEEGRMVNEELARRGVVTVSVYPPNVRHVERIRAAVEEARRNRRGLWSGSAFECAPADHRAGRCS